MTSPTHVLGHLVPGLFQGEDARRGITSVSADSRHVAAGSLFFALPGSRLDGQAFVGDALARGAVAIVGEFPRPAALARDIAFAEAPDARLALANAAAVFYPRQPGTIVAVTGTSGKSSVVDFTRQIFTLLGCEAASLGTIGVITAKASDHGSLTTPDPVSLHRTLDSLAAGGITHLAMEASSHGLDQRRLDGVRLGAAAFLNLGRDHLDYHATMSDYLAAKLRLFELLPEGRPAIVNADSDVADEVAAHTRARHPLLNFGRKGKTLQLAGLAREGFGQRMAVMAGGRSHDILLPLAGDFQASNALAAALMVIATGAETGETLACLPLLKGVPGRMERVGEVNGALVVVDYAHKPDALRAVLATLRPYATGSLTCVFGCGGDRDRGKRPLMGKIAVDGADMVIVTDDNPRTEAPEAIRAEIMAGATNGHARLLEIADRNQAIHHAMTGLKAGDVLVIAGKGHETGQVIGTETLPFSDHDAARAAMASLEASHVASLEPTNLSSPGTQPPRTSHTP